MFSNQPAMRWHSVVLASLFWLVPGVYEVERAAYGEYDIQLGDGHGEDAAG